MNITVIWILVKDATKTRLFTGKQLIMHEKSKFLRNYGAALVGEYNRVIWYCQLS